MKIEKIVKSQNFAVHELKPGQVFRYMSRIYMKVPMVLSSLPIASAKGLNAVDLETGELIGIPDHHVVQLVDAICRVLHYDQE